MALNLRDYQQENKSGIQSAWSSGYRNVLYVLPTGGGKTVVLSHIVLEHDGHACMLAHRRELIGQISLAIAKNGIKHRILAPTPVIRQIVAQHVKQLGRSYYEPGAVTGVASVDTVAAQMKKANYADQKWAAKVSLWVQDEAHHVLQANKWGKCLEYFPNAIGLGVTATPTRADGRGLGSWASGVFDTMIEGPTMRWLITQGYLTDYRIICSENHLALTADDIGSTGDYKDRGAKAVKQSHVIGDVVANYVQWCAGKRGVTFVPDVEIAGDIANSFRVAGVPAEALSAKSQSQARVAGVERLASGQLQNLVNVDLFGEGFDLPAIDVVQFARPTESFSLYAQQFGRVLRPVYADGYDLSTQAGRLAAIANGPKPLATIIDHVGNVVRHNGPPDRPRVWSLDDRERKSNGPRDSVPVIVCLNPLCLAPYEKFEPCCPYCGQPRPEPTRRDGPEFVDGDLTELDAETLAKLRGEEIDTEATPESIRLDAVNSRVPAAGVERVVASKLKTQQAQTRLRDAMQLWSGWQLANGLESISKRYRKFFYTFGIDALTARTLDRDAADKLTDQINQHMGI